MCRSPSYTPGQPVETLRPDSASGVYEDTFHISLLMHLAVLMLCCDTAYKVSTELSIGVTTNQLHLEQKISD